MNRQSLFMHYNYFDFGRIVYIKGKMYVNLHVHACLLSFVIQFTCFEAKKKRRENILQVSDLSKITRVNL